MNVFDLYTGSGWPYGGINLQMCRDIQTSGDITNPVVPLGSPIKDARIRETGNIIYEPEDTGFEYKMSWSGRNGGTPPAIYAGFSSDGISWTRYNSGDAIVSEGEDPYIIKVGNVYYLYCEEIVAGSGTNNIAYWTSFNFGGPWTYQGTLLSKNVGGVNVHGVASPCMRVEGGTYYLFYEGAETSFGTDGYTWLATSTNPDSGFTNRQLILRGQDFDFGGDAVTTIVCDDIIKVGNRYYFTHHTATVAIEGRCFILVSDSLTEGWDFNYARGYITTEISGPNNDADTFMIGLVDNKIYIYYYDDNGDVDTGIMLANLWS